MIRKLLRKLIFVANGRTIRINEKKVRLPIKFIEHFNVRRNNPVEPELYGVLSRLIKKDNVFIDIGANIGIFSLLASEITGPKACVIVVEPNPVTFGFLSEIIAANKKYDNLILFQLAISDNLSLLPLQLNQDNSILMERASIIHQEAGAGTVNVFTNRIDNIVPINVKPDILKIDVEGAELAVLEGARSILDAVKPIVCIEVHGLYFDNPQKHVEAVFAFFEEAGYYGINIFKNRVESVQSFMEDSGVPGNDPVSKKLLNKLGYGNLIFVSNEMQKQWVLKACETLNS